MSQGARLFRFLWDGSRPILFTIRLLCFVFLFPFAQILRRMDEDRAQIRIKSLLIYARSWSMRITVFVCSMQDLWTHRMSFWVICFSFIVSERITLFSLLIMVDKSLTSSCFLALILIEFPGNGGEFCLWTEFSQGAYIFLYAFEKGRKLHVLAASVLCPVSSSSPWGSLNVKAGSWD